MSSDIVYILILLAVAIGFLIWDAADRPTFKRRTPKKSTQPRNRLQEIFDDNSRPKGSGRPFSSIIEEERAKKKLKKG